MYRLSYSAQTFSGKSRLMDLKVYGFTGLGLRFSERASQTWFVLKQKTRKTLEFRCRGVCLVLITEYLGFDQFKIQGLRDGKK